MSVRLKEVLTPHDRSRSRRSVLLWAKESPHGTLQAVSGSDDGDEVEIIGVTEAARRLRMTRTKVINLLNAGELPGRKLGKTWRIYWPDVVAMLRGGKPSQQSHPNPRNEEE